MRDDLDFTNRGTTPLPFPQHLEEFMHGLIGRSRVDVIRAGTCAFESRGCKKADVDFTGDLDGAAEYMRSGICERCQRRMFGRTKKRGP